MHALPLPSTPQVLIYQALGFAKPVFGHVSLILAPDKSKLSKRHGATSVGEFREDGFLAAAMLNYLSLLGWNDGSGKEVMPLEEMADAFSIDRIHKGGAKFDFEKAKWFNQEWIKHAETDRLLPDVAAILRSAGIDANVALLQRLIPMVKERCTLLTDFVEQTGYFFRAPETWDLEAVRPKWTAEKGACFARWAETLKELTDWDAPSIESSFRTAATTAGIKPGELQLPLRVMLVGGKFGPPVFEIAGIIGQTDTLARIHRAIEAIEAAT